MLSDLVLVGSAPGLRPPSPSRVLVVVTTVVAVTEIAVVAAVMARRYAYPYELEWLEGAVLQHARLVASGRTVYVAPSIHFAPFYYTPLYYYVAAAAEAVAGRGFVGPRLVSIAASAASLAILVRFVWRETSSALGALCAGAAFVGSYWWTERFFDVGRIDMLQLVLVLAGAYTLRFGARLATLAFSGAALALAIATKQPTLVVVAVLAPWAFTHRTRREFRAATFAFATVLLGIFACLEWQSRGEFSRRVLIAAAVHPNTRSAVLDLLGHSFAGRYPVLLAAALGSLIVARRHGPFARVPAFHAAFVVGTLAASILPRIKVGGHDNTLIPVVAALALQGGVALGFLLRRRHGVSDRAANAALALALAQLLWLLPPAPQRWVPSPADRAAGDRLVALIGSFPGDVLVPTANYLSVRAGKEPFAHQMNLQDLARDAERVRPLREAFGDALARGRFEAVILNNANRAWLVPIPSSYEYRGRVFAPGLFEPKSGSTAFVPAHLYVYRGPARRVLH